MRQGRLLDYVGDTHLGAHPRGLNIEISVKQLYTQTVHKATQDAHNRTNPHKISPLHSNSTRVILGEIHQSIHTSWMN